MPMSSFLATQLRLMGNTWTFLNCPEVMLENITWNVEDMKHFILYKTSYGWNWSTLISAISGTQRKLYKRTEVRPGHKTTAPISLLSRPPLFLGGGGGGFNWLLLQDEDAFCLCGWPDPCRVTLTWWSRVEQKPFREVNNGLRHIPSGQAGRFPLFPCASVPVCAMPTASCQRKAFCPLNHIPQDLSLDGIRCFLNGSRTSRCDSEEFKVWEPPPSP